MRRMYRARGHSRRFTRPRLWRRLRGSAGAFDAPDSVVVLHVLQPPRAGAAATPAQGRKQAYRQATRIPIAVLLVMTAVIIIATAANIIFFLMRGPDGFEASLPVHTQAVPPSILPSSAIQRQRRGCFRRSVSLCRLLLIVRRLHDLAGAASPFARGGTLTALGIASAGHQHRVRVL